MLPVLSLLVMVQPAPSMNPVEIQPGLYVLPGSPDATTLARVKTLGITHVINLRTPEEGDFEPEASLVRSNGGVYLSRPVGRESLITDLDAFRALMLSLPSTAKVLVHCASGNRAGGALFAHWTLDRKMPEAEAMALAKKAGLRSPTTEAAVQAFVAARRPRSGHSRFSQEDSE